jgi:Domain of unknown function (DUF4157)
VTALAAHAPSPSWLADVAPVATPEPTRVRRPVAPVARPRASTRPVLRRCACGTSGAECAACRMRRLAAESAVAPAPAAPARPSNVPLAAAATGEAPQAVYDVLARPGSPLDPHVRGFMESRLGGDLSGTRIHTDARAQHSAALIGAHAYTVGRDVVFGAPGLDARRPESLATLAHELAHSLQDGGARWDGSALELDSPDTPAERSAHSAGASVGAELRGGGRAPAPQAAAAAPRQVRRQTEGATGALGGQALATAATTSTSSAITGSLSALGPGATLPAGERLCFPPGPIMGPQWGSGFGTIAERVIELDYCDTFGCSPATDYVDNFNPTAYLNFMRAHNPSLTRGAKRVALTAASVTGIARPDLMTDNGVRKEYYEIKPFSPDGVGAGMEKLTEIIAFMAMLSLPYRPGTAYSPSKDIPLMSGTVLGEPLGVALNVQRHLPGLVTYSLCLRGNLSAILAKVALTVLLAWIIAQLIMMAAPVIAGLVLA